ncbi:MAG: Bax inhibitor-1/YccA family protein, partial [Alphaproteobacteria bacterium]|nr:Bax inhibitor-1/YccA family protein [Alphaproteobacteria bacterium]
VYNRMALGVLITAITALMVSSSDALMTLFMGVTPSEFLAGKAPGIQSWIVMFAPLAIIWFGFNPMTMKQSTLQMSFFAISFLYGVSFSIIALIYTGDSIARAFFIATGMFAGLSIFGYVTKKNLSGVGNFAAMAVIGVLVMSVLNMFIFKSAGLVDIISIVGILAFAGITAWQTQIMKEMYHPSAGADANSRMAWSAALTLYISFIALFQYILQLVGNRE